MSFSREECEYTKFNIENHKIEFDVSGEDGILISVPFADDTPQCIKDKLNDIIYQEMNKYLETVVEECMGMPCCLRLNARMQIQYSDNEFAPHYYLSMVITDIPEIAAGTWIDKDIEICSETFSFQNEFISYCQCQLNKILFPFQLDNQKREVLRYEYT